MANTYRNVKWNNIGTGAKVRVRRSIWLAELQDFGAITDAAEDLPTAGATHRGPNLGSVSGTREYVDLSTVSDLTVVDNQDHGLLTETASTAVAWKLNTENTNISLPANYPSAGTALVGGEGFADGWDSTRYDSSADSSSGQPRLVMRVSKTHPNQPTNGADDLPTWHSVLANLVVGDIIVVKVDTNISQWSSWQGTVDANGLHEYALTATSNVTTTEQTDRYIYEIDVDKNPSENGHHYTAGQPSTMDATGSTFLYEIAHTV